MKAIAAGELHSLALKEDGTVVAWGWNNSGQSSVPAGLSGVKAIAGGGYHSLALRENTMPPAAVNFFAADAGEGKVSLSWDNPSTLDFKAVRILRPTTGAATGPEPNAEQTKVYEGTAESFTDTGPIDTGLTYGTTYHYTIYARDDAGNYSRRAVSSATPYDTTAPNTTITSGPTEGARVNATRQAFEFNSTEAGSTFECSVNGAAFSACSSGDTFTFIVGSNTFEVKATDAAGNQDQTPATRAFTVDSTAPDAPSITAPATNSFDRDGSFDIRGTAEPGSTVKLYEGATQVGTDEVDPQSGAWTIALAGVSEGSHAYKAKATDAAGNVSQDSQPTTVVVDKTAPTLTAKTPTGTGVARNSNVSATLSESMDEASVKAAGTVKLELVGKKGKTTPEAASVTYNPATRFVTLDPATNLGSKATYTVTITTAAKDKAGNALARPETWTFTTGPR